jgi:hypothetical protein
MERKMKRAFLIILILTISFTLVTASNQYNYVYNGSSWVPALATADGQQKYWINMANASFGNVVHNLTIGEKIIFGFGEAFDNFVDGWIRVSGNLVVNENISAGDKVLEKDVPLLPRGAIIPFYLESCPAGWQLADGSNGTPDLRGIFIRGAGTNSVLGNKATYGNYYADTLESHSHGASGLIFSGNALAAHGHADTFAFSGNALPTHYHSVDPPSTSTSSDIHNHAPSDSSKQFIITATVDDHLARMGGEYNDYSWFKFAPTTFSDSHSHTVNIASFNSGSKSAGTPSGTITGSVTSASAGTPSGTISGSTDSTGSDETAPASFAMIYCMKE